MAGGAGIFKLFQTREAILVRHVSAKERRIVSNDLHRVLTILHDAGARHVPAEEVDWPEELAPTVFHALNMMYVTKRDTDAGREFSLTGSGFRAIGKNPPHFLSISSVLRRLFRRGDPDDPSG